MSYILDALKKLEQEKVRKIKSPGSITIAGELFSEHRPARRDYNGRKAALAILVAVILTFAATWYLLKGKNVTVSASTPVVTAKPVVLPPASQIPVVTPQAEQPHTPPVAVKQDTTLKIPSVDTTGGVVSPAPKTVRISENKKSSQQLVQAPADIQVNGVAWQDDRGLRRAVVNGVLLKEGSTVAGAQLKEILPDRVRFERAGALFEVLFVSSSPAAGR